MPRKGPIPRREVLPDPIYGGQLGRPFREPSHVRRQEGRCRKKIFYGALEVLAEKTGEEALRAFERLSKP